MCESFGEGPERLTQGEARTIRPKARGPNYSHHLHSDPARALSESRNSADLFKGTDLGSRFLILPLLHLPPNLPLAARARLHGRTCLS
eukprot:9032032-Pyramimonas_sp.AAC.1